MRRRVVAAWALVAGPVLVAAVRVAPGAPVRAAPNEPVAASPAVAVRREPGRAAERSVWDSVYTAEQAARGQVAYNGTCARCHMPSLGGADESPALTGGAFLGGWNGLTLGAMHDRVRKTMPTDAPGTYGRQLVSDVMAYMLKVNGFPAGTAELPKETEALNEIRLEAKKP